MIIIIITTIIIIYATNGKVFSNRNMPIKESKSIEKMVLSKSIALEEINCTGHIKTKKSPYESNLNSTSDKLQTYIEQQEKHIL